tara:strand:- start:2762 stop:3025 length:264 start_codon:yes stop_codon:yes gene_type:complete
VINFRANKKEKVLVIKPGNYVTVSEDARYLLAQRIIFNNESTDTLDTEKRFYVKDVGKEIVKIEDQFYRELLIDRKYITAVYNNGYS